MKLIPGDDPRLHKSVPREPLPVTAETNSLAHSMLNLMYQKGGIGLAAPQIGEMIPLVVLDVSPNRDNPYILYDPMILKWSKNLHHPREGCLSFPDVFANVRRHKTVQVSYTDELGEARVEKTCGLLAQVIQHELDHLDGVVITDKRA